MARGGLINLASRGFPWYLHGCLVLHLWCRLRMSWSTRFKDHLHGDIWERFHETWVVRESCLTFCRHHREGTAHEVAQIRVVGKVHQVQRVAVIRPRSKPATHIDRAATSHTHLVHRAATKWAWSALVTKFVILHPLNYFWNSWR